MISRRVLIILVAGAVLLPIAIALLVGTARLLGAMQDAAGEAGVNRAALAAGVLWALDLVVLVTISGLNSIFPPDEK